MKFKAFAYKGCYELYDLGLFDSEAEAMAELEADITAQLRHEPECLHEDITINFWGNSHVVAVGVQL